MNQLLNVQVKLTGDFHEAIERVTAALKQEGFGVLTRIDVHKTLQEKLNQTFRPYAILGACNPALAHQALQAEPLVGLLLPCNITVEQCEEYILVSVINPEAMLGIKPVSENQKVLEIAAEARQRLERVARSLES